MAEWHTLEPDHLQRLAEETAQASQLSIRSVMQRAGLNAQTLQYWRSGDRLPRPDSLEAVAAILLIHGERLVSIAKRLRHAAVSENVARRAGQEGSHTNELGLFDAVLDSPALGRVHD